MEEEAKQDAAKRARVGLLVRPQSNSNASSSLWKVDGKARGFGGGGGSAAKCPVDFNDATSEWNQEGEISPFKASTQKDKNPSQEKKKLKCNTCVRLLTRLQSRVLAPMPLPHFLLLDTGAGPRKIHLFLGATQPPHKKKNCCGSSDRRHSRSIRK